jgi:hypothetical protein
VFDDTGNTGPHDAGVCIPGCPASVTCGTFTDCTGHTLACGSPCTTGTACMMTSTSPPLQSCQAVSCTGKCGVIGEDACSVSISCGGCQKGDDCVQNVCVASSPSEAGLSDACPPLSCMPGSPGSPQVCGPLADSCGHSLNCNCPPGQQCYGGMCSAAAPPECVVGEAGKPCGSIVNACGSADVSCGGCTGTMQCESNICAPCTPPTCGTAVCGDVSNGCGPAISCGTCSGLDEVCVEGACCTHTTCSALIDSGAVKGCATVSLGCRISQSCDPCKSGDVCDEGAGTCAPCVPKTCSDFDEIACELADGCGNTLDCCGTGMTCEQGICCPPGQVNYEGTCCQPGCSRVGPQISCGVTIICSD